MNPLAFLNPGRWLLYLAAIAAAVVAYNLWAEHHQGIGAREERAAWEAATAKQKVEAASTLAAVTTRALTAERALNAARAAQEKTDAENKKLLADQRANPLPGSRAAGGIGLRDPHATGCRCGGGGAASGTAPGAVAGAGDATQASGLLSEPLERLLLELTDEADALNIAYASCRADAFEVRKKR